MDDDADDVDDDVDDVLILIIDDDVDDDADDDNTDYYRLHVITSDTAYYCAIDSLIRLFD